MNDSTSDHYKGLAAAYTDAIRASDFKANIVMFFLSLTIGPIIFNRDKFPPFLSMVVVVTPFLVIFFSLFVALLPRYPKRGRASFFISGKARPGGFRLSRSPGQRTPGVATAGRHPLRHFVLEDDVPAGGVLPLHFRCAGLRAAVGDLRPMIEELDGHAPAPPQVSAKDAAAHYRNVISAFTESIRLSDFKANVAIVFAGIMMGPIVAFRDKMPHFLALNIALAPFLLVFVCLLVCLYPRYGRQGRVHFVIARNAAPHCCFRARKARRSSWRSCRRCARSSRASSIGRR